MKQSPEDTILDFFKLIGFPGIRRGESDDVVWQYLKSNVYNLTPDLVAGPLEIKEAPIEGLFFIDVIQPSSDLLFKSECYKDYEIDVPNEFKTIFKKNEERKIPTGIDMLPTLHHECYLKALNKKLDKYAHQRIFDREGEQLINANFGLVHHFNLGVLGEAKLNDVKNLITALDYIRFYKRLSESENIDLINAENLLLNEIVNEQPVQPYYLLLIGREWADIPCLFCLLHISIIKRSKMHHLALIFLNTSIVDNTDGTYPIHKWFADMICHPNSRKILNKEYNHKKVQINIAVNDEELFS